MVGAQVQGWGLGWGTSLPSCTSSAKVAPWGERGGRERTSRESWGRGCGEGSSGRAETHSKWVTRPLLFLRGQEAARAHTRPRVHMRPHGTEVTAHTWFMNFMD